MTGQRTEVVVNDGACGKYSDEESLLYDREEDYGKRADAAFGGVSPAEGVSLFKFMEQGRLYEGMCAWVHRCAGRHGLSDFAVGPSGMALRLRKEWERE